MAQCNDEHKAVANVLVFVQNNHGNIVWEMHYPDFNGAIEDLRVLNKPSCFGNKNFRIVIKHEPLNEEGI